MNYVAIIAGAASVMILGTIWFHPKVLGKSWMEGAGLTEEDMKSANPMVMIGALLMALVISWAIGRYASHTQEGMSQFVHGLYHGFTPAIFFVAPVLISKGLFEKKPIAWILTGAVYWVLAITLVGGVVYALMPVAEAAAG
ncbi:MAG: DUF1761 domain-containing protein [Saprospiraceae bacterium]|nr:DUF1761 domain-containing protein [Saprospiraceae bacterium]